MTPDQIKPGTTYEMRIGGRTMDVKVTHVYHDRKEIMTTFGPVPFSNLYLLHEKEAQK